MMSLGISHLLAASGAAFLAGGINSVAGGGTLITFPALLGLGLPAIAANATSTVAIWPGSLGSIWGFRRELETLPRPMFLLAIPAVLGGLLGALLLRRTPANLFVHLVPFLILFPTVLFAVQAPSQARLRRQHRTAPRSRIRGASAAIAQFVVGIYGGYFGAGMSIMMLTLLAVMGMEDILQMSGLTSFLS